MKAECSNNSCRSVEMKKVVSYNDGDDNLAGLSHYHLECQQCGAHFNLWSEPLEKIKKVFGDNWKLYV